MKKPLLVLILLFSTSLFANAQWEKLFSFKSSDVFREVIEVSSGGYLAVGYMADSMANDTDAYVVRLNTNGDTTWTFRYNGPQSYEDLLYKVIETSDNGFLAVGWTKSVSGVTDDFIYLKLSSSGALQWVKFWGASGTDHGQDVVENNDGYLICGYTTTTPTYYDALLLQINFNGDTMWSKKVGSSDYEDANTIELLPDGGYLLGGQGRINGNYEMYIIRAQANGDTLWTKYLGTPGVDNIDAIARVSDGYVLAGGSTLNGSDNNGYVVKIDTSGNVLWTKAFGGSDQDDFHSIENTTDGGFILAGTVTSYGDSLPNIWLMKLNSSGDSTWAYTFGGDSHDHGYYAMQTTDGGYIICGHTGSFGYQSEDGFIIKTGATGTPPLIMEYVRPFELINPLCTNGNPQNVQIMVRNFGYTDEFNVNLTVQITGAVTTTLNATIPFIEKQSFQIVTLSPSITASGSITFNASTDVDNDVCPELNNMTKTINLCTGIEETGTVDLNVYPNPANDHFVVEIPNALETIFTLFDNTGAVVKQEFSSQSKTLISTSELAGGIYLLKVSNPQGYGLRRVVVE